MNARALLLVALALIPALSCATAPGLPAPLGIVANGRHFVDGNGRPCFWMGDTEWELFRAFPEEDARAILEDRRRKGFNVLQIMILGIHGMKKANAAGEKPFLNGDLSTPNEAFFAIVDRIVKHAEKLGQTLVIGVYHKSPDTGPALSLQNARRWGAWVGRRYRDAPNLIWSMYPEAKAASLPIVRELAAGLADGDEGRHLITVHPDPAPASSSWIHEEPWLSFNTLQSFKSDFLNYRMVAADAARTPAKAVVNGEARYEEEGGTTPLQVRRGLVVRHGRRLLHLRPRRKLDETRGLEEMDRGSGRRTDEDPAGLLRVARMVDADARPVDPRERRRRDRRRPSRRSLVDPALLPVARNGHAASQRRPGHGGDHLDESRQRTNSAGREHADLHAA